MSRIGYLPIEVPDGVEVSISKENLVTVEGTKGSLEQQVDDCVKIKLVDGVLTFERSSDPGPQLISLMQRRPCVFVVWSPRAGYPKAAGAV